LLTVSPSAASASATSTASAATAASAAIYCCLFSIKVELTELFGGSWRSLI
jgi:hypothetical protein